MKSKKNIKICLLTVAQFAREYPIFSESSLRHLIFNAQSNGFSKVIRRIGKRKILLNVESFFDWIENQNK